MRRRLSVFVVLFAFLAIPQIAMATLIHNKDDRAHTIKLEQGSGSVSATVKAKGVVSFRCASYPCTIKLAGSSVKIGSSTDDVVIKDGKLVLKQRVAKASASSAQH